MYLQNFGDFVNLKIEVVRKQEFLWEESRCQTPLLGEGTSIDQLSLVRIKLLNFAMKEHSSFLCLNKHKKSYKTKKTNIPENKTK